MQCTYCSRKSCRTPESCGLEAFDRDAVVEKYHTEENQQRIRAAARLVDGGRAGTLNRLEETMEFAKDMGYERIGLAYCYGKEAEAVDVQRRMRSAGLEVSAVSCTTGAMSQESLNDLSTLPGVSCNPLSQAAQLNSEGAQLAVLYGLCMGHDILFTREFSGDVTTLWVKDRRAS
ncbi:DUF1847 domain-containing protein [Salinispira pacifica]|uniref:Metal-binding protein n=1 Tax=Salinispira pacifica TaxID=1307761 RepID=V5WGF1_9SPIO|nr:DUF1847 domain-containing protein [Salinispira pacifica]AHC14863.1 hypothetical protein L21SP2_1466 [Salinispira pacifica]